MPKSTVRIRMYRPGLGDCFLLTFTSGAKKSHILIDCGIFVGTPNEAGRVRSIAADILKETGKRVQALVATHEHWDHVAGFFHAKAEFEKLAADEVWVAWTEDPNQEIAAEKKKFAVRMTQTIGMAVKRLSQSDSLVDRECGGAIGKVLGFEGLGAELLGASDFSVRSDAAMDFVTKQKKESQPFWKPGDVIERDWLPGVRVYVLGPPEDKKALKKMDGPEEESFESSRGHSAAVAWASAMMLGAREQFEDQEEMLAAAERMRPFDVALGWPEGDALAFSELTKKSGLFERYRSERYRTVDNDWLFSGANLALQLDNAINNTSLVLAFELIDSKKVLLFVGDAQYGNWQSWDDLEFSVEGRKVTVDDLLRRTVFYKVGHHGSGNATRRSALEKMTSSELVAAIPTDEAFARDKKHWEMPAPKLKTALLERTKGRILRADPGRAAINRSESTASDTAWKKFENAVEEDPLFVDYEIEISPATATPSRRRAAVKRAGR